MLAELVATNAAYPIIKKFRIIGREITDVLSLLKNLVTAEEELRARGIRKKNGLFSKVMGEAADDFESFSRCRNWLKSAKYWIASADFR